MIHTGLPRHAGLSRGYACLIGRQMAREAFQARSAANDNQEGSRATPWTLDSIAPMLRHMLNGVHYE